MYAKNAIAAMATTPAARPSSPSMRFTAFTIATTHSTVSGTPMSEPSDRIPCPGNQKYSSWTPSSTSTPAARICPAAFTPRDVPRLAEHLTQDVRHLLHLRLVHPERGRAGRADADAARLQRRQRIERDRVLVQGDADLVADRLGVLPGDAVAERTEIGQHEVRVGAPGHRPDALVGETLRQRAGAPHDA